MEQRLSRDQLEAVLHAPLFVYSMVAGADGEAIAGQFMRLREEVAAGSDAFPDMTVGSVVAQALAANLDVLWEGYQAAGRSPRDGLKRAVKALRRVPDQEAHAYRQWLLTLAMQVADVRHGMGEPRVSPNEAGAIRELAGWLGEPAPEAAST